MVCGRRRSRREDRSLNPIPPLAANAGGGFLCGRAMTARTAKPVSLAHFLPEFETEMQNGWFAAAAEAAEKIDR